MAAVKISGIADEIPVGKILCLGRNYRAHAAEMGSEVPSEPVVFLKPASAVLDEGEAIRLPAFSRDVHHEVELVVLIGREGRDIPRGDAMNFVIAYGVGLDLTARDRQAEAKKKGLPWTLAKGFDGAAPLSHFVRAEEVGDPQAIDLWLTVNGEARQRTSTALMIFPIDETIAWLSRVFTLSPGDLIYTGTPEGVGPIRPGDRLDMGLGELVTAHFEVAAE